MTYEKILKRPCGNQLLIEVHVFFLDRMESQIHYRISISTREKGKRKWKHFPLRVDVEEQPFCTPEEILEAKLECWQLLKPQ